MSRPVSLRREHRLKRSLVGRPLPRHIAIVADGNRRWARKNALPVADGFRQGARNVLRSVQWCYELGVDTVTVFLLSERNIDRPNDELEPLLRTPGQRPTTAGRGAVDVVPGQRDPGTTRVGGARAGCGRGIGERAAGRHHDE
ncbi:undecaprenyl diphosphate synthase family protein, partial [Streptomyces sp. NPDC048209]|uniref:undecaprenyl diphosphate synthase family protein n=1 Tax=Streptomyces sp. NPDC048209 TaxID=3156689 RepID=UPI00342FC128